MRANAYYIKHQSADQSNSCLIKQRSQNIQINENFGRDQVVPDDSVLDETVLDDKRQLEVSLEQSVCEGPAVDIDTSQPPRNVENEGQNTTQNKQSTFSIVQDLLKVLVTSGPSSLVKPFFCKADKKLNAENQESLSIKQEAYQCDKENIPPGDVHSATAELRQYRKNVIEREKRQLMFPDQPLQLQLRTLSDNKCGGGKFVHMNPSKRMKCSSDFMDSIVLHLPTSVNTISVNATGGKTKIRRRSVRGDGSTKNFFATQKQMIWFLQLVDDPVVSRFLEADVCRRYADKYLLAIVFAYFVRSEFEHHHYTKENFFAALYLAHDMEEDEEELKYEVFPWALGRKWRSTYSTILRLRDEIFWKIDCRAVVSRRCCDQVMEMSAEHWLWNRERPNYHGGARRDHLKLPEDNGHPRGPFKSPLQCQKCFERDAMESDNSYLLYISDVQNSSDENCIDGGEMKEHKDSGFETLLCDPSGDMSSTLLQADIPRSEKDSPSRMSVSNGEQSNYPKVSYRRNVTDSDTSSAYDVVIKDMKISENELCNGDQEEMSCSQADTVRLEPSFSQEF